MNNTIILVHPFASEKFLYSAIKDRGYKIITLITPFDVNWIEHCMETINKNSDFILKVDNEVNNTLFALKQLIYKNQLTIKAVINAFDYSLTYSDTIANNLLNININLEYSKIRDNKFKVIQELARHKDIATIKSLLIENISDWFDNLKPLENFKFPVIIKPSANSAARNNMAIAYNIVEAKKHIETLFNQKSIFSNKNHDSFIIQEYIVGEEYAVNSVALGEQHKITSISKYIKTDKRLLAVISLTQAEQPDRIERLLNYHKKCLELLKFSYGMAHVEYIIDNDGQPYLIEVNNRLPGLEIPYLNKKCYHSDEVNTFLDLVENKPIKEFDLSKIVGYYAIPGFTNYINDKATDLAIPQLHSEYEINTFRKERVEKAKSGEVFDQISAGIYLINTNYSLLQEDMQKLRQLEADGKLFI